MKTRILSVVACLLLAVCSVLPQPTEFKYQGKLTVSGSPANGNYDFRFALFDSLTGGTPISTYGLDSIMVTDGVFSTIVNFAAEFPGSNRYIEIQVRPTGTNTFTILSPREKFTSSPYSIKSISAENAANATTAATATNALQLGGVAANQYVVTGDTRLSDARNPLAGSASYIQNTTNPQSSSNFNISGSGLFGGNAGIGTTAPAARLHVVGTSSSINAPIAIVQSSGSQVPLSFRSGANEALIRSDNGGNLIFATIQGTGKDMYFRAGADAATTEMFIESTNGNVGIGTTSPAAKLHITPNGGNILFGGPCDPGYAGIGFLPTLSCTNYSLLGNGVDTYINRPTGGSIFFRENNATQMTLGPGGTLTANGAGITNLNAANISSGVVPVARGGTGSATQNFVDLTTAQTIGGNKTFVGDMVIGTETVRNNLVLNGRLFVDGMVNDSGGFILCTRFRPAPLNVYEIVECAGARIRHTKAVKDFTPGLNMLDRLRPVHFIWKESGQADLGLIAEEVAKVEPLLATYDEITGDVKGVKYDRVGVLMINAVKELKAQIEGQKKEIDILKSTLDDQRSIIDLLRQELCKQAGREAVICRSIP